MAGHWCTRSICGDAFDDPRLELVIADGVKWVKEAMADSYDLAFIDATDALEQGGPGDVLYTESFYRDCRRLMTAGGILVTQNAVPFMEPNALARPAAALKAAFSNTAAYKVAVPSFFGGDMIFVMASQAAEPLAPTAGLLAERFARAALATRYYTPSVHLGAFALPPCISELMA